MLNLLPQGLLHVLEVYRLIRNSKLNRIKAVKEIAKNLRIDPQTVTSACTRSLGISTKELDLFLEEKNTKDFHDLLVKRFPNSQEEIDLFFGEITNVEYEMPEDPTKIINTLYPKEQKDLLRAIYLKQISDNFNLWLNRPDMPNDVKEYIKNWLENINDVLK